MISFLFLAGSFLSAMIIMFFVLIALGLQAPLIVGFIIFQMLLMIWWFGRDKTKRTSLDEDGPRWPAQKP